MRVFVYESVTAGELGGDIPASLEREGRAMRDAVVDDFRALSGIEVVTTPGKVCQSDYYAFYHERGPGSFHETAAGCDWTLVIAPEFSDLVRGRSQAVLDAGGRLLGSLPAAIRLTGDKLASAAFWKERGVPHPRTELLNARKSPLLPRPWVLKPRHGAGSQATFLIRNDDDERSAWAPAFHECPDDDRIVQQYVRGRPASVSILMGTTQTIPLLPAAQHLSRDGRFRYLGGSMPLPEMLAGRAVKLALQAVAGIDGLRGYVGIDLVLGDDGADYAIEINPRLTTSYLGLRRLCRQNLAVLMLRMASGETVDPPTWHPGEVRFAVGVDGA